MILIIALIVYIGHSRELTIIRDTFQSLNFMFIVVLGVVFRILGKKTTLTVRFKKNN